MAGTQWDRLSEAQKTAYPQNIPGAINNRIPFMLAKDAAGNLPNNPTAWNDSVESLRKKGIDIFGTAMKFTGVPWLVDKVDQATNGDFSKLLMAGAGNVRKNYAFNRDIASKNAALGLLSGMFSATGAVLGGIAGFGLGGPLGAAAGASLGTAAFSTLTRDVAKTDYIKRTANELYRSSKFADTNVGQETYNFGRDATRFMSGVTGVKTLGDTTKGIGAITSGILNFGFEVATGPDVGLFKGVGAVARPALVGAAIVPEKTGLFAKILSKQEAERAAKALSDDIDLIKRTVAGEKTAYTPVFDFYRNNDVATVSQRPEFRSDMGQIAANLVAGADNETIGMVLRVGRLDYTAVDELAQKSAAKLAEYNRIDDAIRIAEEGGQTYVKYDNQILTVSSQFKDNLDFLKAEVKDIKSKSQFLTLAEDKLHGSLTDRTVSRFGWAEQIRNDLAKERLARKLEQSNPSITSSGRVVDDMARETKVGGVIQGFYQKNPFSTVIRWFDRTTDDAPRGTINFNDALIASDRFRANIRGATRYGALKPEDGLKLYNEFISAADESTKFNIVQKYTENLAKNLAVKYNISSFIVDDILKAYDDAHRSVLTEAKNANLEGRTFMTNAKGEAIEDPQLISQLANGAYLPDPKLWDKAFKRYADKHGAEASLPVGAAVRAKFVADEFNTLWRGFTLLRAGFPINIIRDTSVRMLGDGALFPVLRVLSQDALHSITNSSNTTSKVKSALGPVNPKKNLSNIREDVMIREETAKALDKALREAGHDTSLPIDQLPKEIHRDIKYLQDLNNTIDQLRHQEKTIMSGVPMPKRVSRDKINIAGYEFASAKGGRFGDISMQQLRQREDLRRALSSIREIEASNIRRSRTGSRAIEPREDEQLHLISWQKLLQDEIANDGVARILMKGGNFTDVNTYLRSTSEGQQYLARMGLRPSDGKLVFNRVAAVLKQFAPTSALHKLILDDNVTVDALRKLYPEIDKRPVIISDLVRDMLGTSNAYQKGKELLKQGVTYLATEPTSKLMYAPYFAVKYEQKLQNLVFLANTQGRKLTLEDRGKFERLARQYAIKEYREKLNAFHRDMNYSGMVNYLVAFFPAVVEQFRAYGKITMEHPDFLPKAIAMRQIPDRVFTAEEDPFGQKSIAVELPILGLTGRVPVEWFNVFNPTGSSLLSAGPVASAGWNEYMKRWGGEDKVTQKITNWMLPFGVQANSLQAMVPNTVRRTSQLITAAISKDGQQFNKDSNMFLKQERIDFVNENHRQPTLVELGRMSDSAGNKALVLSMVRVLSSLTLPAQPRYVTAFQPYADELAKMRLADPINGEQAFIEKHPDMFLLADSLSQATSGLRSDDTAVNLVRGNPQMVKDLVAILGKDDLPLLGAIFNDDNYAFSSKAQAWLETTKIPKTNVMFKDVSASLDAARSSVIGKGWNDWNKFVTAIEDEVRSGMGGDTPYNPNRGYGKQIVDYYKKQFLEEQKTLNPAWYDEYNSPKFSSRQAKLVDALSYAINDDKMWKDLSQNPRWYAVAQYLNFRYEVYDELKASKMSIDSPNAAFVRENVAEFVDNLKRQNPTFSLFYERYFANDKFDHVYGG